MADSSKSIIAGGGILTVVILGCAWMYAASSGSQAELDAVARYEALTAREAIVSSTAPAEEKAAPKAEPEAATEAAPAEPEVTEVAEAEPAAEEPKAEQVAEADEPAAPEAAPEETAVPETEAAAVATAAAAAATAVVAAPEPTEAEAAPAAETTAVASVAGDAAKGAKVFRKCKACHAVGEGAKNKVGPELNGIVGRPVGSLDDFKYSDVFQAANAENKIWDAESLNKFLEAPRKYMAGTKMAFAGIRKESQRADLIAYLSEQK